MHRINRTNNNSNYSALRDGILNKARRGELKVPCNDKGLYLYEPGNVVPRERERYISHSNASRK